MGGFTKLFSSIVTSSLWVQDDTVLRVWIAMLATSTASGKVNGSIPGLANLCMISIPEMQRVVSVLTGPDEYSRTPAHDGRRLVACDGGWMIVNYSKYREMRDEDSRKEYQREWVKEKRAKQNVDRCRPVSPQAEAEADSTPIVPKGTKRERKPKGSAVASVLNDPEALARFQAAWKAHPRRKDTAGDLRPAGNQAKGVAVLMTRLGEGVTWLEVQEVEAAYLTHPDVKRGFAQNFEVFWGDNGHWFQILQIVRGGAA